MQRRSNWNLLDVKFCWYCFLGLRDEVLCDIADIFWRQKARVEYERKGVKDDTNVFSSNIMIDCVAINWDREDCDEWTLGLEFCNSVLGMLILRWLSKSHWKQLNRQLNEFRSLKFRESSREGYLVAQTVKASAYNEGDPGSIPGLGRFSWRRKWQPTAVLLLGKSHGWRSLVGYSSRGRCRKESDMTEWLRFQGKGLE